MIDGVEVGARSADERALIRNRQIGFVFQGFHLMPRTPAIENVELPLLYRRVGARARRRAAALALCQVGLEDRALHTPAQLSGGQQQRVAIARALVTEPPLLLADEPTGNLDSRTSLEVMQLFGKLVRHHGVTIVIVTHEDEIARCADRIITMRDGKLFRDILNPEPTNASNLLSELPPA